MTRPSIRSPGRSCIDPAVTLTPHTKILAVDDPVDDVAEQHHADDVADHGDGGHLGSPRAIRAASSYALIAGWE